MPMADAQPQTPAPAQRQDRAARLLRALDKNKDGTVDLAEAKQAALGRARPEARSRLERALTAREATFKAMDKDNDGMVSKDEYLAEVETRFNRADRDRNGTLSLEELRTPAGRALTALLGS